MLTNPGAGILPPSAPACGQPAGVCDLMTMARTTGIYRAELRIDDRERARSGLYTVRLARHPSETAERLMIRLLAFIGHADTDLNFGRDLCRPGEPALLRTAADGSPALWVEVGLPAARRLLQAAGRAPQVSVWAYGGRAAEAWWQRLPARVRALPGLEVRVLAAAATAALAARLAYTMRFDCRLQHGQCRLTDAAGTLTLHTQPRAAGNARPAPSA